MADEKMVIVGTLTLNGEEFDIIPKTTGQDDESRFSYLLDPEVTDGDMLRFKREAAGFTQAELAERIGKSQTLVSRVESGEMKIGKKYLKLVSDACRTPTDHSRMFELKKETPPSSPKQKPRRERTK